MKRLILVFCAILLVLVGCTKKEEPTVDPEPTPEPAPAPEPTPEPAPESTE